MFDVNLNPNGGGNAIDMGDPIKDAEYYRLSSAEAKSRFAFIRQVVDSAPSAFSRRR